MPEPHGTVENLESEVKLSVPALFVLPELIEPAAGAGEPGPGEVRVTSAEAGRPPADEGMALAADDGSVPAEAPPAEAPLAEAPFAEDRPPATTAGVPVEAVAAGRRSLRAAYHDSTDLRLARSGVTLRHRTGEGPPTWTLKLPAEGSRPGDRLELSVRGSATAMPATLRRLVTAQLRRAELVEVVRLNTRRDAWTLRDASGQEVAEVVDDLVSVVSERRVVARFRELEIERRGIAEPSMTALLQRLEAAGAVAGDLPPKLMRALGPRSTAAPDVPVPVRIRRSDPAATLVIEAVRDGVRRLLSQDARVRLGRPDAVHQMRVACRRLRSDLRTFAPLLDASASAHLREELAWLADALGGARDLEVLRARLSRTFKADPLSPLDPAAFARLDALLAAREVLALEAVARALDEPRYVVLLDDAVVYSREPALTDRASGPVRSVLPALVAAVLQDLDARVGRLTPKAPDARWHAARIRAKRARYAAEAASVAVGAPATRTGELLEAVQEILGDHQDAAVAADELLSVAAAHPGDAALVLLCGRLAERERHAVHVSRQAFGPAWEAAAARKTRRWLD